MPRERESKSCCYSLQCQNVADGRSGPESLRSSRENGLKMRALFFTRDHPDVDVFEAGVFKQLMQFNFTEAEPMIGIQFARLLELMAEQIQNDDAASFF